MSVEAQGSVQRVGLSAGQIDFEIWSYPKHVLHIPFMSTTHTQGRISVHHLPTGERSADVTTFKNQTMVPGILFLFIKVKENSS